MFYTLCGTRLRRLLSVSEKKIHGNKKKCVNPWFKILSLVENLNRAKKKKKSFLLPKDKKRKKKKKKESVGEQRQIYTREHSQEEWIKVAIGELLWKGIKFSFLGDRKKMSLFFKSYLNASLYMYREKLFF